MRFVLLVSVSLVAITAALLLVDTLHTVLSAVALTLDAAPRAGY